MAALDRRNFLTSTVTATVALTLPSRAAEPKKTAAAARALGPLLGHVDTANAIVWYRAAAPGEFELTVQSEKDAEKKTYRLPAQEEHDFCIHWRVTDLQPNQKYTATVQAVEKLPNFTAPLPVTIQTPMAPDQPARVTLAMGSCASSTKFFDIWQRIADVGADGMVLLGDTPYINKTDLQANRDSHCEFLSIPTLIELVRTRPLWATWDDHDFGGNDTDGKQMLAHRDKIRQAFIEYRGLNSYGTGTQGIYTNFRYGPLEVFLVDPRYFSQTEPSPVAADKPTCLGKEQWQWLLGGLQKSTAPFKLIATGMIWDDKKNKEKDDWETYAHEREALYDFIGEKKISGVVLIGGDIHASRHLRYPLKSRLGYDLEQWIVSPMHEKIIPSLNIPHPALQWGEAIPHVFLQVIADTTQTPATLTANWITSEGKTVHSVKLNENEMKRA